MPAEMIKAKLKSAERRIAFVASRLEGVMARELKDAISEIKECTALLQPDVEAVAEGVAVLLVDDEEIIRRIGSSILSREGFSVILAADGSEALGLYEQNRDRIKCVVLDLVMPKMDGMQAFRHLRKTAPNLGIIITTGYGEDEIRKKFGNLNLQGFLRKPFTTASLVEMVGKAISHTEKKERE